jgi:hypothetical protein
MMARGAKIDDQQLAALVAAVPHHFKLQKMTRTRRSCSDVT